MSISFQFSAKLLAGVQSNSATVLIRYGKDSVTSDWVYPPYTTLIFVGLVPTILALCLLSLCLLHLFKFICSNVKLNQNYFSCKRLNIF